MKSLVLVGFMGTGKSAVARELGSRLQWPLEDTDAVLVRLAGKPITAIFAEEGEPRFRELETRVLADLAAQPSSGRVIATGGGIVLAERNWPLLRQLGHVINLAADPEIILARVGTAKDRPLLAGSHAEVMARIQTLLAARAAFYRQADWTCDTSRLTIPQVADAILDWCQQRPA